MLLSSLICLRRYQNGRLSAAYLYLILKNNTKLIGATITAAAAAVAKGATV